MDAGSLAVSAAPQESPPGLGARRSYRHRLRALVTFLALVSALAAVIGAYGVVQERTLLFSAYDRGIWAVVQTDRELQRLISALDRHAALDTDQTAEALRLRYDLLWSRYPVLIESQETDLLRGIRGFSDVIRGNFAEVQRLADPIAAIADGDAAELAATRQRLDALSADMQRAMQIAMAGDRTVLDPDAVRSIHARIVSSFGVLLLCGLALFLVLLNQRSEARRLASAADRARSEAQRAEARLRDAIENTSEGFLIADAENRIVVANQRFRDLYPWAGDALEPGTPVAIPLRRTYTSGGIVVTGSVEAAVEERLALMRQPQEAFEQHFVDGRTLLISERRTDEGDLVSVRTDVTRLKQSEGLLRARLAAMDAAHDGIGIAGPDGRFTYLNPAHARMLGREDPAVLIGMHWSSFYPPDEAARLAAEAIPSLEAEGAWRGNSVARTLDGRTFDQDMMLTALPDGGTIAVVRDISERKRAEAERDALREQFFRAQKLEAVGRLAGGIAHDFNNILAAILGYAQLVEEDLPEGETRNFAGQIRIAGNRARELVGQILAFTRGGGDGITSVPAASLVRETAAMLRATLPATVDFSWEAPDPAIMVRANPTQLSQVLMNLCVNAVDALDGAPGRVRITCGMAEPDPAAVAADAPDAARHDRPPVRHRHTADGRSIEIGRSGRGETVLRVGRPDPSRRYYRFSVEDSGSGIAPDAVEHIFDPFFTTKDVGQGSGLGLPAVMGIVTGHDGAILVTSADGEGCRFDVLFPLSDAAQPAHAPARAVHAAETSRPPILVVDDEPAVLDVMLRRLRRAGFAVEGTSDPAEAERRLAADPCSWSLLITDLQMPGMTGIELAAAVRRRAPAVPILLCSGQVAAAEPAANVGAPVDRVLSKPVDDDDLLDAVAALLDRAAPAA